MSSKTPGHLLHLLLNIYLGVIEEDFSATFLGDVFLVASVDADNAHAHAARCDLAGKMTCDNKLSADNKQTLREVNIPSPPPDPSNTTQSPDFAVDFRSAAYTVTPAQSIGAAAAESRPSGTGVT